jgi:penicillin-binding protein 1A
VKIIKRIFKFFWNNKILRYGFLSLFLGGLVGGGIAVYMLYQVAQSLPHVEDFISKYRFTQPSLVYDAEGRLMAEMGTERRYPISIAEMPADLKNAVVAVEDARFYEHSGIDYIGIARAMVVNIRSGRYEQGGSTLTQQLVKNLLLSSERKLIRKFKEAVLAHRFDSYLTKDEILEFYLNYVNFGRGGYGAQAAAIAYFGKDAKDLTLAESAMLAGIPRGPSIYAPHLNKERALQRRNIVLLRMFENGYITEDVYNTTIEEPIEITKTAQQRARLAGYFMDYTLKFLSEEIGITDAESKGLRVYTTINMDYQVLAEKAIQENLIETSKSHGYYGPVGNINEQVVDNVTAMELEELEGEEGVEVVQTLEEKLRVPPYLEPLGFKKAVVAAVEDQQLLIKFDDDTEGKVLMKDTRWARASKFSSILSVDDIIYVTLKDEKAQTYDLQQDPPMEGALMAVDPKSGAILTMVGGFAFDKSMFNRSVQAMRQVGSVFKPIVYATAIDNGAQPMAKILDAPVLAGGGWRPGNNEGQYYGPTTIKEGLTRSRNVVAIKVAEQVGIQNVLDYAKRFGITSNLPADLTVPIGSGSIPLIEMVYAYTTFPNMGTRPERPFFVTRVEDIDGEVIFEATQPPQVPVISANTAMVMNDILQNVVEKGTGFRAKEIARPVGAKTGTTNENRDAWFIGYLPNLVVGVWVGFDEFDNAVGYGGSVAAPVWVSFMRSIIRTVPAAVFPAAKGVVYRKMDVRTWEPTNELIQYENGSFEPYVFEEEEGTEVSLR